MPNAEESPQRTKKHLARLSPGFMFWASFLALNFILFLPLYLLNYQDATFLPRVADIQQLIVSRSNPDIFRLNLEISLLILSFPLLRALWPPRTRRWYARLFFLIYLLALVYAIYESVILSFFHTSPIFFNDYRFFKSGIGFLLDGLRLPWWQFLFLGMAVLGAPILLYLIISRWFNRLPAAQLGRGTRIIAATLIILMGGLAMNQGMGMAQPENVISSLTMKLVTNARVSLEARGTIQAYDSIRPEEVYHYTASTRLLRRPDVYLIFVESYGSVLYKRPHFTDDYIALMKAMQARLQDAGWAMETGLSTSPTWGGGSWMAYTSAKFGLHIGAQPQFLAIKARYSHEPYPSLGRYLQSQGYQYIRLAPIQRQLSQEEERANDALYGPDRWITFSDLDYQGPLYGWGPSPPDQFSLHKTRELLQDQTDAPLFFFYLTQNSHYPFAPQPSLPADWRALNNPDWSSPPPIGEPVSHRDNIVHYREAIRYQWESLSDFILTTPADEEAIFILIGDHQPPRVSRKEDGYETPIHIIARDADFVRRFQQYGFEPGLIVSDLAPDMKHEALYAMLVRELVDAFGVSSTPLPYLPDGIQLHLPTPTP